MFDFTNRVVVITGASSGLGSQMAKDSKISLRIFVN